MKKGYEYTMEIVVNKIETAIYKMDKELNLARNADDRREAYAKTIGRIEGIAQNAKAQMEAK